MKFHKFRNRAYLYTALLNLEIFRSHINYTWKWRGEYYRLSLPFNPFRKDKYGFEISEDGTSGNARFYRPKREWGLVEPQDPEYLELMRNKK